MVHTTFSRLGPAGPASRLRTVIKLENVSKIYKGEHMALRDATVDIDKGEFVFLVGPLRLGQVDLPATAQP